MTREGLYQSDVCVCDRCWTGRKAGGWAEGKPPVGGISVGERGGGQPSQGDGEHLRQGPWGVCVGRVLVCSRPPPDGSGRIMVLMTVNIFPVNTYPRAGPFFLST